MDLVLKISKGELKREHGSQFGRTVLKIFYFKKIKGKNEITHPPRPSISSLISTLLSLMIRGEQGDHFLEIFSHHNMPFVVCGEGLLDLCKDRPFFRDFE
jgi:hypothetical protein